MVFFSIVMSVRWISYRGKPFLCFCSRTASIIYLDASLEKVVYSSGKKKASVGAVITSILTTMNVLWTEEFSGNKTIFFSCVQNFAIYLQCKKYFIAFGENKKRLLLIFVHLLRLIPKSLNFMLVNWDFMTRHQRLNKLYIAHRKLMFGQLSRQLLVSKILDTGFNLVQGVIQDFSVNKNIFQVCNDYFTKARF